MKNNQNYYDSQEMRDYSIFTKFNDSIQWFTKTKANPKYAHIDVVAKDSLGNKYAIELKERNYDLSKLVDVFIEPLKVEWLRKAEDKGAAPIYINIFNNGDTILVWDFRKKPTLQLHQNVRIWDKGASQYKYQDRYGLLISEATIFTLDKETNKYRLCQPLTEKQTNQ